MRGTMSASWEKRLTALRDLYLAAVPLAYDRSGSPEDLAQRAVIRGALPAAVTDFRQADARCVRLELAGHFGYRRATLTDEARHFLGETRERITSKTEPGGDVIWIALDANGSPLHPLQFALQWSLDLRREQEIKRRQRLLADVFGRVAWHEVALPVPDGTPDERIRTVARIQPVDGSLVHSLEAHELTADMQVLQTLSVVPSDVEAIVQTARLLYVRGWNQWEFFTLAKREAVFALEAALRRLDSEERGHPSNRPFKVLLEKVGRSHQPPLLSEWERDQGQFMRDMRNEMTHLAGGPSIDWISWAHRDIELAIRLINLSWARQHASVPVELAWEPEAGAS